MLWTIVWAIIIAAFLLPFVGFAFGVIGALFSAISDHQPASPATVAPAVKEETPIKDNINLVYGILFSLGLVYGILTFFH